MQSLYSIFDRVSGLHNPPFPAANDQSAARAVQDALAKPGNPFSAHAGDYELMFVGAWDEEAGHLGAVERRLVVRLNTLLPVSA